MLGGPRSRPNTLASAAPWPPLPSLAGILWEQMTFSSAPSSWHRRPHRMPMACAAPSSPMPQRCVRSSLRPRGRPCPPLRSPLVALCSSSPWGSTRSTPEPSSSRRLLVNLGHSSNSPCSSSSWACICCTSPTCRSTCCSRRRLTAQQLGASPPPSPPRVVAEAAAVVTAGCSPAWEQAHPRGFRACAAAVSPPWPWSICSVHYGSSKATDRRRLQFISIWRMLTPGSCTPPLEEIPVPVVVVMAAAEAAVVSNLARPLQLQLYCSLLLSGTLSAPQRASRLRAAGVMRRGHDGNSQSCFRLQAVLPRLSGFCKKRRRG
mmetsp:Transcript_143548/g.459090  ORF Transcript_143548/g.459090 Transcript_143548/m.459090 type:complete len:319 (-) Transcript_143548:318-1274(-)